MMHWSMFCPKCGEHEGMEFKAFEPEEEVVIQTWSCTCGAEGYNTFSIVRRDMLNEDSEGYERVC